MSSGPVEVFVVQLARSSQRAQRFLRARIADRTDREDVISAAVMWCWENRDSYSLTVTLDVWFLGVVRNVYRDWSKGETQNSAERLDDVATGDTTLAAVESQSAADALARALPPEYRQVAQMDMKGMTRQEMKAAGVTHRTIDEARARIRQLRKLIPDDHEYRRVLRASVASSSDDAASELSEIDREIEALEFAPPAGKDCPPCWRCKWFEGYMPGTNTPLRMPIHDPVVARAVSNTESEKIRIAQEVRDGLL
jgi:DNA-directed RNA polymerase specialized sigma24 family protein